jgi:hypothetical protein
VDRIKLAQDRNMWRTLMNRVIEFRIIWRREFLTSWGTISFSGWTFFHGVGLGVFIRCWKEYLGSCRSNEQYDVEQWYAPYVRVVYCALRSTRFMK